MHQARQPKPQLDKNVFTLCGNRDVGYMSVAASQPRRPSQSSPQGMTRQAEETQAILIDWRMQRRERREKGELWEG